MRALVVAILALTPICSANSQIAPRGDYHQHLFSPNVAALITGDSAARGITADDLIAMLDSAQIQRAVVLSVAYTWASANRPTRADEYERVKAENDWTSSQVARYPDRLRAFCSVNPLKSWALDEVARCARDPQLKQGLKLHFGNSDVDLDNPENVAQVRKIFQTANDLHMSIVVHMRTSISKRRNYGREQALAFLNQLLPAAPNVTVQIAHLAGAGDYDSTTDAALGVFAEAIARRDRRMKNVWFDATTVVLHDIPREKADLVARRIRQVGVKRVLYGSDARSGNPAPREGWADFQKLPLSAKEIRAIAGNVPPYMRK
jgi:predicted TIM-barrel fold metal-dependent hydrolase